MMSILVDEMERITYAVNVMHRTKMIKNGIIIRH